MIVLGVNAMGRERASIFVTFIMVLAVVLAFSFAGRSMFQAGLNGNFVKLDVSGGVAGMRIEVDYYSNGSVVYRNFKTGFERHVQVPEGARAEFFESLKGLAEIYPGGLKLEPRQGSADFFTYRLTLNLDGKVVVYEWTDTSVLTQEVQKVFQAIMKINDIVLRQQVGQEISLNITVEGHYFKVGEKVTFKVTAKNVGEKDFSYSSPTPCHPNFKVTVRSPDGIEVEVYPKGVAMGKPCIQVLEERVLKAGEELSSEYEYVFHAGGNYTIRVWFPYAEWSGRRWVAETFILVR